MEPAQKRQRPAATTMQRLSLLPKEAQVGILMWAMEPTPSAALVKAAIGDRYGNPGWWADILSEDDGFQAYLNCHTHCHRLWSRALEALPDGSLAWKWSPTNVFVNRTGHLHTRGAWADYENERAILGRKFHNIIPDDPYVTIADLRQLHMHWPPTNFRVADVPHGTSVFTSGYIQPFCNNLLWNDAAKRRTSAFDGLWHCSGCTTNSGGCLDAER